MMTHSMSNMYESSFLTALLLATGRITFDPKEFRSKKFDPKKFSRFTRQV